MNSEIERDCVSRLLSVLGDTGFALESPASPAPDVRVTWANGRREAYEVTEVHPDEVPGAGSATVSSAVWINPPTVSGY